MCWPHVVPSGLQVVLHDCDIVLMSYEVLRKVLQGGTTDSVNKAFAKLGFWRIVLDEAQLVANSNSVAATVRWSLWLLCVCMLDVQDEALAPPPAGQLQWAQLLCDLSAGGV